MNCDEAKPYLYDRVLEGVRDKDAEAHLASCETCKAEVETIVNQAVAASEQRQRAEIAGVIQNASERMSEQLHYLESAQSQSYKQAELNHAEIRQFNRLLGSGAGVRQ